MGRCRKEILSPASEERPPSLECPGSTYLGSSEGGPASGLGLSISRIGDVVGVLHVPEFLQTTPYLRANRGRIQQVRHMGLGAPSDLGGGPPASFDVTHHLSSI